MPIRDRFPRLSLAGREVAAFARQAWLLRHDASAPVLPEDPAEGDQVVVFLHGLFATAGVLRPMRAAVTRNAGIHAAALTYPPGPGIVELADRLASLVRALPEHVHVHVVGHSLGGLVGRWFVQEIGYRRVVQTISLATPFAGVPRSGLLGFDFARDMDASSPLLRRILLGDPGAPPIPHLSIIAADDTLIPAPLTHVLPGGDVAVVRGVGHNTLLYAPEVTALVERRVLAHRSARAA